MNIRKAIALAISALAIASAYPQNSIAETFTSREFLTWSREGQASYLHTAIGMAGLIAKRYEPTKGKCIDDWYFGEVPRSHDHIQTVMQKYPNYHPLGVVLAVLEKQCGKLR